MSHLAFSILIVVLLFLTATIYYPQESVSKVPYHDCPAPPAPQDLCPVGTPNTSKAKPIVRYPTLEELYAYLNATGGKEEFMALSNSSQGLGSNVRTAVAGNTTWVAWEGNVNGTNRIFLKVAYNESLMFTPAVELSAPDSGDASNLQLAASENGHLVYAAWQDTNLTTGKNRIFVSASMDGGEEFRTYSLNLPGDSDSTDPELTVSGNEVVITWIQNGERGECSSIPGTVCSHGRW